MPNLPRVSVLIHLYNEEQLVSAFIERVLAAALPDGLDKELVVVDDGSRDASAEVVEAIAQSSPPGSIRFIRHQRNRGKGAAIRTAIQHATGDFVIIQELHLEYDPAEYARLLAPLMEGRADAVFGDSKAFRLPLVKSIPLRSNRFGIEPELTIKLAQRGALIYELPFSYHGRNYAFKAFWTSLRYGLSRDIYLDSGAKILDALAYTPRFNRWMADVIFPHLGQTVLEIGAGIGNLTTLLSGRCAHYTASDFETEHLARLRTRLMDCPNIEVKRCDLEDECDFQALGRLYDSVVCLNVLEHVDDDRKGLRNIHSVLRSGGTAVVLVPQDPSIYGTFDRVLGHRRRYSKEELREKMEQAGFELQSIFDFNRVTRPGWILNARILKRESFGRFQLWVFDRSVWLWRRLDRRLPWPAISIVAIGVKR